MKSKKEILKTAKKRFDFCSKQWAEFHQRSTELLQFISGDQWDHNARTAIENSGFAALTSNRIPTFLRQITNEIRKNTPEIQIDPRSDGEEEKAEVINDLVRNIQDESQAEVAYCTAVESATSIGIGYIRVLSKYKDEKSFDQEITIEAVQDANTVMLDPNHKSITGSDSEYAFITTVISKSEYYNRYADSSMGRAIDGTMDEKEMKDIGWTPAGNLFTTEDQVVINEYYFKDYKPVTIYQIRIIDTGEVIVTREKELTKNPAIELIQSREIMQPIVRWCKLNDIEVLEESEWPGEYIPVVAVKCDEYWISGKRKLVGSVEAAVDAQIQLNSSMTLRAQLLQMAPKAPYIGTAAQFKTYEQQWANINVSNQAFMVYNGDPSASGPPQRDIQEVPMQGASLLVSQAEENLKSIFGTFDPTQQAQGPESGKALLARQDQSYNSNYHVYDNAARSIQHVGCIIVQAMPIIYDAARTVQLQSQDGKKRSVSINQPNEEGVVEFDLTAGDYTVSIQTGPSFGTKRQESAEAIMELIRVFPDAAPAIADIAVRTMDWPGADKIADSLEAMCPPQVLQARKTNPKDAAAMVPQLQAQVQQLKQQTQVMGEQLKQAAAKLNENADKIQIEHMKADVATQKMQTDASIKIKEMQLDEQKTELEFLVRERELKIAEAELEIEKAKLGISTVQVMHEMNNDAHDHAMSHIERVAVATPGTGETSLGKITDKMGDDNASNLDGRTLS